MLRLYVLRHAKSARPEGVTDHERPLAARGREAAPVMGAFMRLERYVPDKVLVSTAVRTQETYQLLNATLKGPAPILTKAIYEADWRDLLGLCHNMETECRALMLVGHNPGLADFSAHLVDASKSNEDAMDSMRGKYPTTCLAIFDFDIASWSEMEPRKGILRQFVTPKMLGGVDED